MSLPSITLHIGSTPGALLYVVGHISLSGDDGDDRRRQEADERGGERQWLNVFYLEMQ